MGFSESRWSIRAAMVVPLWLVGAGGLGWLHGLACAANPVGAANPLIFLLSFVTFAAMTIWATRLGRVRAEWFAALMGLAGAGVLIAASFWGIAAARGLGEAPWAAWNARWADGVQMVPKWNFELSGGWRWGFLVLESLLLGAAGLVTAGVESERPYCRACGAWARKGRWKVTFPAPARALVMSLKDTKELAAVLALPRGEGPARVAAQLKSCACGRVATLELKLEEKDDDGWTNKTSLVDDLRITPRGLERLLDWGETRDPKVAGERPKLSIAARTSEPFTMSVRPEGGDGAEWTAIRRDEIVITEMGIVDRAENAYTMAMRRRLRDGDFAVAAQAMRAQRTADDLAMVVHSCAAWSELPGYLLDWYAEEGETHGYLSIRGVFEIMQAWKVRGTDYKWRDPERVLAITSGADTLLARAAEKASKDPTPWAWRLQAAKTLGEDLRSRSRELFAEAVRRAPHHRLAHTIMLDLQQGRWGGSDKACLSFANERAAAAGAGSPLGVLVCQAHIEIARTKAQEARREAAFDEYFRDPGVARELRAAHDRSFHAGPFKPGMDTPYVRSHFAFTLWRAGLNDAAAEHLRKMSRESSTPWFWPHLWLISTRRTVERARKECGVIEGE